MNFNPDERTNFLDLLRPPPGYRLDAAVGTTFSMDFVALTAVLLAFVDAEEEGESDDITKVGLLRAITRLGSRVRVFVDGGHISGTDVNKHGKLASLMDRIVLDASFEDGCFHPKVWVTRYEPKATIECLNKKAVVRAICASRNLSTSTCWETFICFEGTESEGVSRSPFTRDLAEFIARLRRSSDPKNEMLAGLEKSLARLKIDLPPQMSDRCQFAWQWKEERTLWDSFPKRGTRALVVSPFVRQDFLKRVLAGFERLVLVSTQHELDALSDEFHGQLAAKSELFVVHAGDNDDGTTAMDLHAKFYVCESPSGRTTLLGSANASYSAWHSRNCEATVVFSPGLSIDQFCNDFIFVPKESKGACRGWIERYGRLPLKAEDETDRIEKILEKLRKDLTCIRLQANYDLSTMVLHVRCADPTRAKTLAEQMTGIRLRLCPLSQFNKEGDLADAADLLDGGHNFAGIGIAGLTEFMVLDLTHPESSLNVTFVVMAKTDFAHLREKRDAAVLNEFLTPDRFQELLRSILFDGVRKTEGKPSTKNKHTKTEPKSPWALLGEITLEELLQSCTEDPSRIAEIEHLLGVYERAGADDAALTQFRDFWQRFCVAHRKAEP